MPESGSSATDFSIALLGEFVRLGVRDVVLSPGSRSQPLALVCAELERTGAIRLHVRIDERVSGFLALGIAIESGRPALVVTTSGTATANLHPAVLEAHHGRVPMIVLTADRPAELRGVRANQTTVQAGLYGHSVRLAEDVPAPTGDSGEADAAAGLAQRAMTAATGGSVPGPVHLNLAFREPLSSPIQPLVARSLSWAHSASPNEPKDRSAERWGAKRGTADDVPFPSTSSGNGTPVPISGTHTVVVAGAGSGPEAEEFARAGGWPLLAEVSSGARFGPNLVVAYRELLADAALGGRVTRAVVFGHPTLSREVPALIARNDVESVVVSPPDCEVYNPGHRVARVAASVEPADDVDPASPEAREWLGRWVAASRRILDAADTGTAPDVAASRSAVPAERLAFVRAELDAVREPVTRRSLVEALWRATWPHDRLVLGASRLIRDADRTVPGKKITVYANRGLAGIDGTVATSVGVALASQAPDATGQAASGVTRVLLGDLALLHDVGALLFGAGEVRPRIQLIVGNDGGGSLFDSLEVASTAPAEAFDRVLFTPHSVDIASLATAYGWTYECAATRGELDRALTVPVTAPGILEVPLPR